jgi:hypothetical protein
VAIKNQTARCVEWSVPGILAGNDVPNWADNSGSINRRVLLFEFPNQVTDGDMMLGKKLEAEMAAMIVKANRAYLQAVARYARDNVWKHLPAAFHEARDKLKESINPMEHFFMSGCVDFREGLHVPMSVFTNALNQHAQDFGFKRPKVSQSTLEHPLLQRGCTITGKITATYCGALRTEKFVMNCDLASSASMAQDPSALRGPPSPDPLGG